MGSGESSDRNRTSFIDVGSFHVPYFAKTISHVKENNYSLPAGQGGILPCDCTSWYKYSSTCWLEEQKSIKNKRRRRRNNLKKEMSMLHFLQLCSLKEDQKLRLPKAATFQPHILLFPISNPFLLSFCLFVSYFISDSKVKPSATQIALAMQCSPGEQGICFSF